MVKEFVIKYPKVRVSQPKMLTYDDYVKQTPPDSGNYELLNGQIIYMASSIPNHQKLSMRLTNRLFNFIELHKLGELLTHQWMSFLCKMTRFNPIFSF